MKISFGTEHKYYLTFLISCLVLIGACQQAELDSDDLSNEESINTYLNTQFHNVPDYQLPDNWNGTTEVKNIVLMIGDGMGTSQVFAGIVANKGKLHLQQFDHTGFSKTSATDSDITDSAAGATALACGVKTYNGAIGVDPEGVAIETILEKAEKEGLSTGLVATCRITHATPASFIAHQSSRQMYEEIALDFTKTDIDVFIGGGKDNFDSREDNQDLLDAFAENGYSIVTDTDSLQFVKSGKLAGLIHDDHQPRYSEGRGNMLEAATKKSLELLSQNPNGFFLMIEGSQIDWGGHGNDTGYIVEEMLDFDRAVGIVMDFAIKNPGTLVIVTADHETGGFSITDANQSTGMVEGTFTTDGHTGVMVPVFAFGSKSELFSGIYENTDIYFKMMEAIGF